MSEIRHDPLRQTFPIIFAAPSGAGKTSIARELDRRRDDVEFSISATTRPARASERDGIDYHFRSETDFRKMIDAGQLLEWAEVHGNFYGTPRVNLELARSRHHFLLLDIDVQGSRQVKQAVPDSVSVFVLPPSGRELARRLTGRASETADVRRRRLLGARAELVTALEFDYVLVNDDIDRAVDLVESILQAESVRAARMPALGDFVAGLIEGIDSILEADIP